MRIVIADDAVLLRAGVERLLTEAGHEVVAAVGDADALLARSPTTPGSRGDRRAHASDLHR